MSSIYLTNHGKLSKESETLEFSIHGGATSIIHPFKIKQLIIIAQVEITASALKLLIRYKIDTIFLNKNGRFNAKLIFQEGKNVYLRQKQYKMLDNNDFMIHFAKAVVKGKLKNQLTFMQRIIRERKLTALDQTTAKMKDNIVNLDKANTVNEVRGYEGLGSKYYFSIFKYNIIEDWAVFNGRSMNPPKDNVNSVLSFLYTLLSYRVESAIETEGLDCYVGYLHSLDYGRKSLIYDLMEEYRTPVVDTVSAALFNLGILAEEDFESKIFSEQDDDYPLHKNDGDEKSSSSMGDDNTGVLLKKDSLKKVISQFEKKLNTMIFYEPLKKQISYKTLIREQVKHFKRLLNGEEYDYKPFIIK